MLFLFYSKINWICLIFATVILSVFGHNHEHDHGLSISPKEDAYVRSVNDTYHVFCTSPKGQVNTTIWKAPSGEKIPPNKGRIHTSVRQGYNGVALFFESIEKRDKGNYTCSSLIGGQEVKVNFNLIVIKPISFLDTPTTQNATENANTVVRCEVDGDPMPTIVWHVKGQKLTESTKKYSILADGLSIKNVSLADRGEYQCRAFQTSQMISSVEEQRITLRVQHKPTWKYGDSPEGYFGYLAGVVNLTCETSADPPPNYQWYKNNKVLTSRPNATIYKDTEMSVLQLIVSDKSVFAEYACNASNPLGSTRRSFKLREGYKPQPPAHASIHATLVEAVELDIKQPLDMKPSDLKGFHVEYMKNNHKEDKKWEIAHSVDLVTVNKGSWYVVPNLDNDTSYLLRVATRNAAGISDYSPVLSFRTSKHSNAATVTASDALMLSAFPLSFLIPTLRIITTHFL